MIEPVSLRPGVMVARTLLSNDGGDAVVRVINCGPVACALEAGDLLTEAEPISFYDSEAKGENTESDYQHVEGLIESIPTELTDNQRRCATQFIQSYAHIFSSSSTDLGRNGVLPHRIDTGDCKPIKQTLRQQPYAHNAEIERNVQELLAAKVIEPAFSPWASNVLLVRKKDGPMRFCVDYRKLNQATIKDSYPLPRISSCLESLGGSCFFSTLDLRAGYFQTEIDPKDADKTAFVTRSGQYRFTVLSMGLANAPSQFQRLMDLILAGLVWETCLVYLDDIIVYSTSFEQHLERLAVVFERLEQVNLKLKASKCQLFRQEVNFFGHVISKHGISADPEKIRTVANWPRPRNLHELRSFIGLSSYYRRFVQSFADIARPLHKLTEKGQPFNWSIEQDIAFRTLKERLISSPILASPIDDGEYVLDTDASAVGLGAVL